MRALIVILLWSLIVLPLCATASNDAGKLFYLAEHGKTAEVRSLLDRGVDPNIRFSKGTGTALHAAAQANQLEVIQLLIERGADVNAQTSSGSTPLIWAATHGHESAVRLLHKHGAMLDHRTRGGSTALNLAASSHPVQPKIVWLLMDLGADPNIPDDSGKTPLHWTAQYANVEITRMLLSSPKIRLNKLDGAGYTPLYYARERSQWFAKSQEDTEKTIAMLEEAGAKELAWNPIRIWSEIKGSIARLFVSH